MLRTSIGATAFALVTGVWATAQAGDRVDNGRYHPALPCVVTHVTPRPCNEPPPPCSLTETSEIPCRPKRPCWIEPWMCREDSLDGDGRIR